MPTFMGRQGTTTEPAPLHPSGCSPVDADARAHAGTPARRHAGLTRPKRLALGFLAADDGQIDPALHRQRLAIDGDRDLAVVVPAERTGRELALVGDELGVADDDLHRLGLIEELRLGNGAR